MVLAGELIDATWLSRSSLEVAPELVGCTLVRRCPDGQELRGTIVETEAYTADDPACHAYRRRTARNQVMFGSAGFSYVYLIYGMYHCFNVVTDRDGIPSAVLIRALQLDSLSSLVTSPLSLVSSPSSVVDSPSSLVSSPSPVIHTEQGTKDKGQRTKNKGQRTKDDRLAAGPGKLCQVMQIDKSLSELRLAPGNPLWLEHRSSSLQHALDQGTQTLVQTTRIGISQGAEFPWRWYLNGSPAVSKLC